MSVERKPVRSTIQRPNNFFAPIWQDPYPFYTSLRREAPAKYIPQLNAWLVSRYDDVMMILKNPELFSSGVLVRSPIVALPLGGRTIESSQALLSSDPPDHGRLRAVLTRAFAPKHMLKLEARIREIARDLMGRFILYGHCDLMADLAIPVPVTVVAELLGIDPERRADFKRWSHSVVLVSSGQMPTEQIHDVARNVAEFREYFDRIIAERRRDPRDDLISQLVRAETSTAALTPDQVMSFCSLLFIAGNETTTLLIGNAILALLRYPTELDKVLTRSVSMAAVVEEVMRWDTPVQFLRRRTTQEVAIAGVSLPAGTAVVPLLGSANRDETHFPDPDRFSVSRHAPRHLGFGFGVHFCIGAPLARLEARVVLEEIFQHLGSLRLSSPDEPVPLIAGIPLRGPKHLALTFAPARAELATG